MGNNYLVETCLLTFGLVSISNDRIKKAWNVPDAKLCWIENGEIIIDHIEAYLKFRETKPELKFSCTTIQQAIENRWSGALTASGTMEVCRRKGIEYAVSCGIGGIGDIKGEELCDDLPALRDLPVKLIATSPKDMLDIQATFDWLHYNNVPVLGVNNDVCTGYVFNSGEIPLDGEIGTTIPIAPLLILQGISEKSRIQNEDILAEAVKIAKFAEQEGRYYHPAANAALDKLTNGYSSDIQLLSLIDNIRFAETIAK